ncbi:DUF302 domain-containing protein [Colwellia sp. BRX10-3]|uniref:DUF302 domain-containing protein n=1 Tax=Colwellia sp. BRX10-3 TaxID=2759844 RepID=UPI0021754307|nr:DUF302 domain-containing protein [Colwellia sp. BRX10-3]
MLLPCNVVVREEANGTITVSFMDQEAVMQVVDNPDIQELGKEVKGLLLRVSNSLNSDD